MLTYLLFIAPAMLLSMWASAKTKSAFTKYSKVRAATGLTGAQAAQRLLDRAGIADVKIVPTNGFLSDHYNPVTKTLALSEPVYSQPTISAVGVACHEAGHAIQHSTGYAMLGLRSALVPTVKVGSSLGMIVIMIGAAMALTPVMLIGIVLFSAVVLFQLVTLPVEFDASARAKKLAVEHGIISEQEREGVDKVLNAAALTYVAAAAGSISTLLYYLMRSGLLGGRRS